MVPSFEYSEKHSGVDCFFSLFANVFENASDLFISGDAVCLNKFNAQKQPVRLEQIMSRKKDFLPKIGDVLRNVH